MHDQDARALERDDREDRLPRWVRDKLDLQRRRLAAALKRIEGETAEGSTVFADPYGPHPLPLGTDAQVHFGATLRPDGSTPTIPRFDVRYDHAARELRVMTELGKLAILPTSTNTIVIKETER